MGDVIKFVRRTPKAVAKDAAKALKQKANGRTLCDRGFHRWLVESRKPFDVKQGRLVTLHRCERCGTTKTSLT
ncbi:MAG: hypothetical protein HC809_13635 [Gammaproteobacteria bacterium]|nr:hypothetical protein [Gammaproteobacteria bacterium]